MTVDLNQMHHSIHQISGNMALKWCRATPADLQQWAKALRTLADEMEAAAVRSVILRPDFCDYRSSRAVIRALA